VEYSKNLLPYNTNLLNNTLFLYNTFIIKTLKKVVLELAKQKKLNIKKLRVIQTKYPKNGNKLYSKSEILGEYRRLANSGQLKADSFIFDFLKTKPTRTISGVTPVTVLTKPYKCPGNCVFCPSEQEQPKSYLSSEPGAMRARMLAFDPYRQVKVRIQALRNIGHNTDKIELIILGGTWSSYPKKYQVWFLRECFKAMNEGGVLSYRGFMAGAVEPASKIDSQNDRSNNQANRYSQLNFTDLKVELLTQQKQNETSKHRCVGLVIETRPDCVNEDHVKWLRFLGATKIQLGVQTLDDKLLALNKRGHTVRQTEAAIRLLRLAGFKLHLHWMLNLYGSSPQKDLIDFKKLFGDEAMRPDEIKIYPCMLLKNTELNKLYKKGKYKPYSKSQLLELLIKGKSVVPRYCRISRLFRDIPSFEVVSGVKETNFRQIVQEEMKKRGLKCNCIRCREVRNLELSMKNVELKTIVYKTNIGKEIFLNYVLDDEKILGFLRLSLLFENVSSKNFIHEIRNSALIREVHVYGEAKQLIKRQKFDKEAGVQHLGLGKKLIERAERLAKENDYHKIAVISAIGTRGYYRKQGYKLDKLYMHKKVK